MFRRIATKISVATGHAAAFTLAFLLVLGWGLTGPFFDFSNTWQLFINTGTTITTFLMVFLIQNTQNRDGKAMQLKLDELLLATRGRDAFVDLEDMSDDELDELDREFREIHSKQATSKTMKKLHRKIAEEHDRRKKH
jgi:low affinity Fe/Cu permease